MDHGSWIMVHPPSFYDGFSISNKEVSILAKIMVVPGFTCATNGGGILSIYIAGEKQFSFAAGRIKAMKTKRIVLPLVTILFLLACQLGTSVTPQPSVPVKEIRTEAAATVFSDPTATASAKGSVFQAALTADALTVAVQTPVTVFDVSVPASACWIKSSVSVLKGQKATISASGTVNTYGGGKGSDNEPNGQKSICGAIQCPVQGVGYGALIGKLGEDGKPFFVGAKFELAATQDGPLYFTVNDWTCEDNSGAFDLQITIR